MAGFSVVWGPVPAGLITPVDQLLALTLLTDE